MTAPLVFTDDLLTGSPEIDRQHRRLFALANALLVPPDPEGQHDDHVHALRYLRQYVLSHFAAEESFMSENAFPGFEKHRDEHDLFRAELSDIEADAEETGQDAVFKLRLQMWLTELVFQHIGKRDKALAVFLADRNASIEVLAD